LLPEVIGSAHHQTSITRFEFMHRNSEGFLLLLLMKKMVQRIHGRRKSSCLISTVPC